MLLTMLGLIDVLAGLALLAPQLFSAIAFNLGIIVVIKGLLSLLGSFAAGYFLDFMGAIDLIAGIMLLMNFSVPWFWVLPLLKGVWSIVFGLLGK